MWLYLNFSSVEEKELWYSAFQKYVLLYYISFHSLLAGVTENKYSPKISTPPILISWEICTPPVLISREICTPLGKKVLLKRALRDGKERNNLFLWRLKLLILNILHPNSYQKGVKWSDFSIVIPIMSSLSWSKAIVLTPGAIRMLSYFERFVIFM